VQTTWAGTPEYMAPEHWRGDALTPAVDVFSFGVVLWEMVTGKIPWELAPDYKILVSVRALVVSSPPAPYAQPACFP
jgi:serine/threonine protein kinase